MPPRRRYRILIVGCGQLGSRHLQAVANLSEVEEIQVVDPRPEALRLGQERLLEIGGAAGGIHLRWRASLDEVTGGSDLCIVATRSAQRPALVREVADRLKVCSFLLEKPVAPSVEQLEGLRAFASERALSIRVNLKTRAYPFHQKMRNLLKTGEPVYLSVVGGNLGLANNGIHAADLFAFYTGASRIQAAGSSIDPVLHPSKRGDELFDLSGTLLGMSDSGSRFTLSYTQDPHSAELYLFQSSRHRFIVDHFERWAMESDIASGWQWRSAPFEGNPLVSAMTQGFTREILTRGRCVLPTLEESVASHRFILGELAPHFNQLMERKSDLCPIP